MNKTISSRVTLLFAAISCLFLSGTAMADGTSTWLPDFNKDTHVYVDPQIKTTNPALSQITAISDKLVEEGKHNNLEVFVVATEAGSEQLPYDGRYQETWGQAKSEDLSLLWQQRSDFPKKNAVVIVWVNHKHLVGDPWSVGGWVGSHWQQDYDMGGNYIYQVMSPILTQHASTDPSRCLLQIVAAINNDIDTYAQRKAARDKSDRELGSFFSVVWKILVGVVLIGIIGAVAQSHLGTDGSKKAALDKINEWEEQLSAADKLATTLRTSYLGLIEHEENGEEHPFEGQTLAAFKTAAQDFREFTARNNAAKERLDEAEKSARGAFLAGYKVALELLTTRPVKVKGPAITLKNAQMFEDFSPSNRYSPSELLTAMLEVFNSSNTVLADIISKVSQAVEEKKNVEKLNLSLVSLQDELTKAALPLDSYHERLKQFNEAQAQSAQQAIRDPLAHLEGIVELRQIAEQVKTEMEEALAAKRSTM